MDYEAKALRWANLTPDDAAVVFAVLHLADQVGRVADHFDQLTGDGATSTALRVDVTR